MTTSNDAGNAQVQAFQDLAHQIAAAPDDATANALAQKALPLAATLPADVTSGAPKPQPGQGDPGTPGSGNVGTGGLGVPTAPQNAAQAAQQAAAAVEAGTNAGEDSGWLQTEVDAALAQGNAEFDNPFSTSKPPPNRALQCTQAYRASSSTILAEMKQIETQLATASAAAKPGLEKKHAALESDLGKATIDYAACLKSSLQMKS